MHSLCRQRPGQSSAWLFGVPRLGAPPGPILVTSKPFVDIESNPAQFGCQRTYGRDSSQCLYVIGHWWLVKGIGFTANILGMQDVK